MRNIESMSLQQQLVTLKNIKNDLECEIEEAQYMIDKSERELEKIRTKIERINRKLNSEKFGVGTRERFAYQLLGDDHNRVDLAGQFKYKNQYAICNGYTIVLFDEELKDIPFVDGIVEEKIDRILGNEWVKIDLKTSDICEILEKDIEISDDEIEYIRMNKIAFDADFIQAIILFLKLDDTAEYFFEKNASLINSHGIDAKSLLIRQGTSTALIIPRRD